MTLQLVCSCTLGTHFCAHKNHVVGHTKGQYQHYRQKDHLQEFDTDAQEHVDWDSSVGQVFEDEDKVKPGEKHCQGPYLPLPRGGTPACIVKTINEDDG